MTSVHLELTNPADQASSFKCRICGISQLFFVSQRQLIVEFHSQDIKCRRIRLVQHAEHSKMRKLKDKGGGQGLCGRRHRHTHFREGLFLYQSMHCFLGKILNSLPSGFNRNLIFCKFCNIFPLLVSVARPSAWRGGSLSELHSPQIFLCAQVLLKSFFSTKILQYCHNEGSSVR